MVPVLLALLAGTATAQVNTEKLRLTPEEEGTTGEIALSVTGKHGNVSQLDTAASLAVARRWGRNLAFVVGSSRYAAKRKREDRLEDVALGVDRDLLDRDSAYLHAHLVAARYNRILTDRLTAEVFAQAEYSAFLLLDLRTLGGAGARLAILDGERGSGHLGLGAMAEYERLDPAEIAPAEDQVTLVPRLTSYLTFRLVLAEDADLVSTTYVQPRIPELGDLRIYDESRLAFDLSSWLSWSLILTLRHDSDPPLLQEEAGVVVPPGEERLLPTDVQLAGEVGITF